MLRRPATTALPVDEYVHEMMTVTPASLSVLSATSVCSIDGALGTSTISVAPSASVATSRPSEAAAVPPAEHIERVKTAPAWRKPTLTAFRHESAIDAQRDENGEVA